jgi:hypothetical protein
MEYYKLVDAMMTLNTSRLIPTTGDTQNNIMEAMKLVARRQQEIDAVMAEVDALVADLAGRENA